MNDGDFTIAGSPRSWSAVSFGPDWNGWAAPHVTRETLEDVLADVFEGHRWERDVVVTWSTVDLDPGDEHDPETECRVAPGPDGTYDLRVLGWMFERVDRAVRPG